MAVASLVCEAGRSPGSEGSSRGRWPGRGGRKRQSWRLSACPEA